MATQIQPSVRRRSRPSAGGVAANTFMIVCLGYFLVPLVWLFLALTKSNTGLFSSFGFWFDKDFHLLQNLSDTFARDNGVFFIWMRNTAIYALSAAIGSSLISTFAGYAFAMYRFAGRNLMFGLVLGSVFVPATVFAVPLYLLLSRTGLSNTLLAVILPALVNPFGIYLMRIYAEQAISPDLIDAARVDGAGEFRIFAQIAFRLMVPGFVTVLLFAFVNAWNNYFLPLLVLSKSDLFPLTVGLAYWNGLTTAVGQQQVLYTLVVTGSVLAILPVMLLFLFLQRYWQSGLTFGSLKG